jgi:hypothetical protein
VAQLGRHRADRTWNSARRNEGKGFHAPLKRVFIHPGRG